MLTSTNDVITYTLLRECLFILKTEDDLNVNFRTCSKCNNSCHSYLFHYVVTFFWDVKFHGRCTPSFCFVVFFFFFRWWLLLLFFKSYVEMCGKSSVSGTHRFPDFASIVFSTTHLFCLTRRMIIRWLIYSVHCCQSSRHQNMFFLSFCCFCSFFCFVYSSSHSACHRILPLVFSQEINWMSITLWQQQH